MFQALEALRQISDGSLDDVDLSGHVNIKQEPQENHEFLPSDYVINDLKIKREINDSNQYYVADNFNDYYNDPNLDYSVGEYIPKKIKKKKKTSSIKNTNGTPFKCGSCDFSFKLKRSLKDHVESVHGEQFPGIQFKSGHFKTVLVGTKT